MKVKITFLISAINFFVYPKDKENELYAINRCAVAAGEAATSPLESPVVGAIAIAKYNGTYYRCEVKYLHQDGRITVRFVDYGNEETKEYERVLEIPTAYKDYLTNKDPLCHQVRLAAYEDISVVKESAKELCSAMNKCLVNTYDMEILSFDESNNVYRVRMPQVERILFEAGYSSKLFL